MFVLNDLDVGCVTAYCWRLCLAVWHHVLPTNCTKKCGLPCWHATPTWAERDRRTPESDTGEWWQPRNLNSMSSLYVGYSTVCFVCKLQDFFPCTEWTELENAKGNSRITWIETGAPVFLKRRTLLLLQSLCFLPTPTKKQQLYCRLEHCISL